MSEILVQVTRGSVVESRHAASVAVVDAEGRLLATAGEPDRITYWRSAAKPVQALPLVAAGGVERFGFNAAELAVMVGSHSGEEVHLQAVQSILQRLQLGEDALRCGAHMPISREAAEALIRAGELPRAVHSNCSGKHAGMLALAVLHGWPVQGKSDAVNHSRIDILTRHTRSSRTVPLNPSSRAAPAQKSTRTRSDTSRRTPTCPTPHPAQKYAALAESCFTSSA
jgi:L-asparaginase II